MDLRHAIRLSNPDCSLRTTRSGSSDSAGFTQLLQPSNKREQFVTSVVKQMDDPNLENRLRELFVKCGQLRDYSERICRNSQKLITWIKVRRGDSIAEEDDRENGVA